MALLGCIDCGKQLSSTAIECNGCNSRDPFGKRRAEYKAEMMLMSLVATVLVCGLTAFYFDILTIDMLKGFLKFFLN